MAKYLIERVSSDHRHSATPPCDGAYAEERTWYTANANPIPQTETVWYIDIESLTDLRALVDVVGEIILSRDIFDPTTFRIRIYDDHIE